MKKKSIYLTLLLALIVLAAPAQRTTHAKESPVLQAFRDSLNELSVSYFAYFRMWDDLTVPAPRHVRQNPAYYKLFMPTTYYEAPFKQAFALTWQPGEHMPTAVDSLYAGRRDSLRLYQPGNLETFATADYWVNRLLRNVYLNNPNMIVQNETYLADLKPLDGGNIVRKPKKEQILDFMSSEEPSGNADAGDLVVLKPNFWKHSVYSSLHFTQNYISDNWAQGGESTNALVSEFRLEANYDDKQRVQFDNKLELKLGFVTAPSDTVHKYRTNADLFRLSSKLGVKAFKDWYYTLGAEFKTQLFPNHKTNSDDLISSFLSPAQLDVTLGMDFKKSTKNLTLSLLGSPLAYNFIYIGNDKIVNPSSFNVEEGKSVAHLFGSKFEGNIDWKILPNLSWISKLTYFTTYDKVIANWENTFEFKFNRFLSTKIFVHNRFDDGVTLTEENDSYFQMKEMLTFGLTYSW